MEKELPCEAEGKLFDLCIQKEKFAPRCIESVSAWDKCMSEYQKLTRVKGGNALDYIPSFYARIVGDTVSYPLSSKG